MIFSYLWLQEYIKEKLPKPAMLADLLSMHSFEVEEITKAKNDWIFDIAVLPNRAHDCLCHTGIAREIAAITKLKLRLPKTRKARVQKGSLPPLQVRIQSHALVPRYTAFVIEGITVAPSPKWLKERLKAVGINSINNVVDLANFVMLEIGQPLHAFDYNAIAGNQMIIREAKEGEKLETLDRPMLSLPKGALVIEDAKQLIDLAGIKGGKVSGISRRTKNIVLQAASFNAACIYRTKSKLKYQTHAANMYAHEISSHLTLEGLERAHALLSELRIGGKLVQIIDWYPKKAQLKHIALDISFAKSLFGISILPKEAKQILESLDCEVTMKRNQINVTVSPRRLDLAIPEDLMEEIGRIHGYETIPAVLPVVPLTLPAKNPAFLWQEKIRDAFKELGFTEVYNYSFIGNKDFSQFAYSKTDREKLIALENPISEDFSYLRDSLVENLLKNVRENHKKTHAVRIFEMGNVFHQDKGKFQESNMLGALVYNGGFYEMKGICDFLLESLGIANVWYDEYEQTLKQGRTTLWNKGKSAEIKIDSTKIGYLGEISDSVLSQLKIHKPVGALHINADELIRLASEEREYQMPSRFPAVTRDIAILVPLQTKVGDVINIIETSGGELVQDIDLFDIYEGENLEQGKKNLAFHIVYQANERTLTNKEVDILHNQIITAVEENLAWEVRK